MPLDDEPIVEEQPKGPVVDIPADEAMKSLTGFEIFAIEDRLGAALEHVSATKSLYGVVWAYENRDGRKRDWASVKRMTVDEVSSYFAAPPADPDSELGKDSTDGEQETAP